MRMPNDNLKQELIMIKMWVKTENLIKHWETKKKRNKLKIIRSHKMSWERALGRFESEINQVEFIKI